MAASAVTSSQGVSKPVTPSETSSAFAGMSVATTEQPAAMAHCDADAGAADADAYSDCDADAGPADAHTK